MLLIVLDLDETFLSADIAQRQGELTVFQQIHLAKVAEPIDYQEQQRAIRFLKPRKVPIIQARMLYQQEHLKLLQLANQLESVHLIFVTSGLYHPDKVNYFIRRNLKQIGIRKPEFTKFPVYNRQDMNQMFPRSDYPEAKARLTRFHLNKLGVALSKVMIWFADDLRENRQAVYGFFNQYVYKIECHDPTKADYSNQLEKVASAMERTISGDTHPRKSQTDEDPIEMSWL